MLEIHEFNIEREKVKKKKMEDRKRDEIGGEALSWRATER